MLGPDATDRETLLALAKMSFNAYSAGPDTSWYNVDGFNSASQIPLLFSFLNVDLIVRTDEDNSTVVLSLKGTSAGWIAGGGGPTVRKDKLNDNMLFSCCCARVGPTWSTVCGCYKGSGKCSQSCTEMALQDDDLYYSVGVHLYNNLTYMYPNSHIWVIGHSLGGAVSSLIGVTFGAPVVTFEAPAEKLAAARLHLPSPPSTHHITHVIHTADPIAMGVCNGVTSTCAIAGYAMETRCHLGKVVLYDTVTKLKWSVDIRTHSIAQVVERLLAEELEWADDPPVEDDPESVSLIGWPWWGGGDDKDKDKDKDTKKKIKLPVPIAKEQADLYSSSLDCFNWEFGEWDE
ncbi:Alpha/Beta hydrolase protein [Chiua virens]|nr:Alpha/Beta hydrolase protein [Chiua virens]